MNLIQIHSDLRKIEIKLIFCLGIAFGIALSFITITTFFFFFKV